MLPDLLRLRLAGGGAGRLDEVEAALGPLGIRVVGGDEELLLELAVPLDLPAIEHALAAIGCAVEDLTLVCAARSW